LETATVASAPLALPESADTMGLMAAINTTRTVANLLHVGLAYDWFQNSLRLFHPTYARGHAAEKKSSGHGGGALKEDVSACG